VGAEVTEPVPLRHNRDFQLLWGGQAVSVMGSQISKIAYPLLVLTLTGSPAKAGIAGFAAMLGYLLFPLPAGALADRFDRKRMMIVCDVIRLAAVGSVAVAGWAAHISYLQVLIAGFVEGSASVFFSLAQRAALPMIVHVSQRPVAVSQNEARNFGAQLAGPAVGGSLFGLAQAAPFAADAFSYLASLATLPFIRAPMQARSAPDAGGRDGSRDGLDGSRDGLDGSRAAPGAARRALVRDLREGLAWTWQEPFLRYSALFAGMVNVLLQVLTLGLIVLARHDGASAAETGFIVACYGAGGLAGAFVAPWIQRRLPAGLTITGCMWVWALLLGAMSAIRVPLWLCPVVVVMGFVGPAWNVSAQTYRMRITPNEMLGRTSSVALQIAWGTIPLGSLLAGFLLQELSPSVAIGVVAAGMGAVALAASATGPIRRAGRRDPAPVTAA
jgi:MFS family permease